MAQDIICLDECSISFSKKLGVLLVLSGMCIHFNEILIIYVVVQIFHIFADFLFMSFISCSEVDVYDSNYKTS